jgi:hypothetical protein
LLAITLEDIMPTENWDKNLPTSSRFTVLVEFNNEAVRDNNTGLVWERSPETHDMDLKSAAAYCANRIIGGAVGWRLPSLIELKSVQDPSLPAPFVPSNIFTVQTQPYWTATVFSIPVQAVWVVNFANSNVETTTNVYMPYFAWCVRGPIQECFY